MRDQEKTREELIKELTWMRQRIAELDETAGTHEQQRTSEDSPTEAHEDLEARVLQRTAELAATNDALLREMAERERVETALHLEREQLLSIFDSINEVISVIDVETYEILYVNKFMRYRHSKDLIGGVCYKELHGLNSPCGHCTKEMAISLDGKPYRSYFHNPELNKDYLATDRIIRWTDGRNAKFHLGIDVTEGKRAEEALRGSEERYRRLFEGAPLMYVITTNKGGTPYISDCNQFFLRAVGCSRDEVLEQPLEKFYSPDSVSELSGGGGYERALSGEFLIGERQLATRDGELIPTLLYTTAEVDPSGQAIGTRAMFVDISDRKRAEEALRKSKEELELEVTKRTAELRKANERLQIELSERRKAEVTLKKSEERVSLLLNSTAEAIYGVDLQGACTFANPACLRMLGYGDAEQLLGKNMHALIHHSYADGRSMPVGECSIYRAFREGARVHRDDEVLWRADGSSFPVEYWSYPQMVDDEVAGAVVTFIDITKRKRALQALAVERQRLSYILEGTNAGAWEWNVQTGKTIFNERWAEIVGYTLAEIEPVSIDTWRRFSHPDDLEVSRDQLEKHFQKVSSYYECETRARHKSGGWIWVLDRGKVATWTGDGKPQVMSGTRQDITARKQAEEKREQLLLELQDALAEVRKLSGFLPICASCKKIRDDQGYWRQVEQYISDHSEVVFSHGICPDCARKLYPRMFQDE